MLIDLEGFSLKNLKVAVAVSGGNDSMALLHFLWSNSSDFGFSVIALNVEHGIRGTSSINDSKFVEDYCKSKDIPFISYTVDSIKKAESEKISLETSARILRYQCFFDAIEKGKCDIIATAHHLRDNVESVLLNLFRGTGLKGLCGIQDDYGGKIIRPFISLKKEEIDNYIKQNNIPYVTDETNFIDDYSRNFIRLNILPKIKEKFPNVEGSLYRLTNTVKLDEEYLSMQAKNAVKTQGDKVYINIPVHYSIFARAVILALKTLGVFKDWETVHIDSVYNLCNLKNGSKIDLLCGVKAYKEYDKIVLTKSQDEQNSPIPFFIGSFNFCGKQYSIQNIKEKNIDIKSGLYVDLDKIPKTAIIRSKEDGDMFTKFGGGTKKLNDYLTDKKVPLRERKSIPILAIGKEVLAIFGIAISDKVKIDGKTDKIIKIT